MSMPNAEVLTSRRDRVGECPVWSVAEQALYWVDIEGRHIHRLDWANREHRTWNTPERVGCISLTSRKTPNALSVVAAMESGVFLVDLLACPNVETTLLAGITHAMPNMRFNDGRCDRSGRLWLSTMCMDMSAAAPVGGIFCLDENGLSEMKLGELITPNGMAFSPDDRTFYLSDSHPSVQQIWVFDFDSLSGSISGRRNFADMNPLPGRPDGATVDREGNYWICGNDGARVHCFNAFGQLVSSLLVPVTKPSMCAFGGSDMNVMFVTSIQPMLTSDHGDSLDGALFAIETKFTGLPEPVFSRFPADSAASRARRAA